MASERMNATARQSAVFLLDEEMAELRLLIPGCQAVALETAAHRRGITTAELVRHLIREYFTSSHRPDSPRDLRQPDAVIDW